MELKITRYLTTALSTFFLFSMCFSSVATVDSLSNLCYAKTKLKEGKINETIQYLTNINLNPTSRQEINLLLTKAYLKNCQFAEAKRTLISIRNQSLKNLKNNVEYLTLLCEYQIIEGNYDSVEYYNNNIASAFKENNEENKYAPYFKNKFIIDSRKYNKTSNNHFNRSLRLYNKEDPELIQLYLLKIDRLTDIDEIDSAKIYFDRVKNIWLENYSYDTLKYLDIELFRAYFNYYFFNPEDANNILQNTVEPILFSHEDNNAYEYRKLKFHRFSSFIDQYYGDTESAINHSSEYARIASKFATSNFLRLALAYEDIAWAYKIQENVSDYLLNIDLAIKFYLKIPEKQNKAYYHLIEKSRVLNNYHRVNYYANIYLSKIQSDTTLESKKERLEIEQYKILSLFKLDSLNKVYELINNTLDKNINDVNIRKTKISLSIPFISGMDSYYEKHLNYGNINMDSLYNVVLSYEAKNDDPDLFNIIPDIWMSLIRFKIRSNIINDSTEILLKTTEDKITEYLNLQISQNLVLESKMRRSLNSLYGQFYELKYRKTNKIEYLELSNRYFLNSLKNHLKITKNISSVQKKLINIDLEYDFIFEEKIIRVFHELKSVDSTKVNWSDLFEYFELSRKSSINYKLARQVNVESNPALIDFIRREKTLKSQLSTLKGKTGFIKSLITSNGKSLTKKLAEKENELNLLYFEAKKKFNFDFNQKSENNLIKHDQLLTKTKPGDVIIHFDYKSKNTYALAISSSKTEFLKLDPLPDSLVQQFRNSLDPSTVNSRAEENFQEYTQSAYAIYQSQLKPVLDKFPEAEKIYVIPDGQLHHIPFDALISELPTDNIVNYKELKYLIRNYTFSYANSATTLFKTKSLLNRLETPGQNILAFAPSYSNQQSGIASRSIDKQPLSNIRGSLANLQWNGEEVNEIEKHFAGNYLLDQQATEANFKKQANKHDILHLSMHAVVDAEDPMYSYLAFTPDPQDTSSGDGFLHAFEIYDMDLNAEMAVLSACNTGYGKLYKGEGPMSLAKAFTYAGCPSVVMSYWPADDKSSSEIMGLFYQNLAEGMNKDVALRTAKLDFLESASPLRQAPTYWNNFVVMGDVSPIVKDQTATYLIVMGMVVLFFLLVWIVLRLVFRRSSLKLRSSRG